MTEWRNEKKQTLNEAELILKEQTQDENRYFRVELHPKHAQLIWQHLFVPSGIPDALWAKELDEPEQISEDLESVLRGKFQYACISDSNRTNEKTYIDLSYREVETVGNLILDFRNSGEFNGALSFWLTISGFPDGDLAHYYDAYLKLNEAFVNAGGRKNNELCKTFEKLS